MAGLPDICGALGINSTLVVPVAAMLFWYLLRFILLG
jgi:hypothetical protein